MEPLLVLTLMGGTIGIGTAIIVPYMIKVYERRFKK